jgi:hypothetical protein
MHVTIFDITGPPHQTEAIANLPRGRVFRIFFAFVAAVWLPAIVGVHALRRLNNLFTMISTNG